MPQQLLAEPPQIPNPNPNTNPNPNPNPDFASEFDDLFDFDLDSINFDDIDRTFDELADFSFPDDIDQIILPELAVNGDEFAGHDLAPAPVFEFSGDAEAEPVSSQGSGSGVSGTTGSPGSVVEQKVKVEEFGKMKRKNVESDSSEVDEKKKARLLRNRESAQMSRQRKKQHVEELEEKVRSMHSVISDLNNRISFVMAENASLRQQLCGNGPPGMYPLPLPYMGYPWMPYAPGYQGSRVVPIPKLKPRDSKPQNSASVKPKKSDKGRTKKVASVTFVGLLFFVLLFGGLVPMVNLKFGGTDNVYDRHRGRVLAVDGHLNGSHLNVGARCSNHGMGYSGVGNSSEQLVASLYVPRNDKLVKIDGNLIIHSVLASEEAKASLVNSEANKREETGLAIRDELAAALAIPDVGRNRGQHSKAYRNPTQRQRALSSGSLDSLKDQRKSSDDGRLKQWFSEGVAGSMLSSGMCTEVFQFEVAPNSPGAIISASAASNISAEHRQNATQHYKGRNRRILQGVPVSLPASTLNITEEQVRRDSPRESFQGNKSGSSVVVSVLVDPREAGDDSMVAPKSLSRIFVVVLLDSVKYVTYSCVLPRVAPHVVAA